MKTINELADLARRLDAVRAQETGRGFSKTYEDFYDCLTTQQILAIESEVTALRERLAAAEAFIEGTGSDLLNRRIADWFPEGANNSALSMSEDMRLIGNTCMDFDAARNPTKEG